MAGIFSRHPKHAYNFHNDESLHDQTPQVQSTLAALPSSAAGIAQLLVHGVGTEEGKRAMVASLPMNNPMSKAAMAKGVKHYWDSMLHPPLSYRGDAFQYRTADGADNNILFPQLGKAGLPYAKTEPGKAGIHGARPDPGDLFDLLMARKDDKESELGISSMLLYHATIIIHDIFRTNANDKNISDTSSYLDLSPLYGINQAAQDAVRTFKYGLLKPDTFAEERLLHQPPGVCIYLLMYSRFHNYVAQQLLSINENGKFSLPIKKGTDAWKALPKDQRKAMKKKQDEDLFQTARLVTCGLYINISIHDYLRVLMRFHTKDTPWTLDPRIEISDDDNKTGVQRGIGNMVSVEFNLLYRFHSPISTRDRKWTEDMFVTWLKDTPFTEEQIRNGELPVPILQKMLATFNKTPKGGDRKKMKFFPEGLEKLPNKKEESGFTYKFKRGTDGLFDDAQLAAEMCQVIEDPMCQFGAQNVPKIFKAIEILGILQARKWEVATLNEFREFFGLKKHKHFEDINEDPEITTALRDLYEDPDMVELYPGLMCEGQGRCLDPGTSGPNGTGTALWSGVFCDAVTLVRSDRFYTLDWNVGSLTAWGMREVTSNPNIMKGSVFHRLFQRAFPNHFKYNTVHLWQPFYTPAMNLILARDQNYLPQLDLSDLHFDSTLPQPSNPNFRELFKSVKYEQVRRKVYRPLLSTNPPTISNPAPVHKVSYYDSIKTILANHEEFRNPGILDNEFIPGDYLPAMMSGTGKDYMTCVKVLHELVDDEAKQMFLEYFLGMSHEIVEREKRTFQKVKNEKGKVEQVFQIDVVKDYAIPIITRFVADFLGFWDSIKTPSHPDRKYNENTIHQHIHNCQDYCAYNADETTTWKRRADFQKSIKFLKERAEHGAYYAQEGWFGSWTARSNRTAGDEDYVVRLREFGVNASRALFKKLGSVEEVAAMKLVVALDAAHEAVLVFTEVVAQFVDHAHEKKPDIRQWAAIQNLAYEDTPASIEQLKRYVLEAQRIRLDLPILRVYSPKDPNQTLTIQVKAAKKDEKPEMQMLRSGDKIILKMKEAQKDERIFPDATKVILDEKKRGLNKYLVYGASLDVFDVKQLTLIGLTGMLKYLAKLKDLRVAHDKLGRLKRAKTPTGVQCYLTIQWDQLVSFPTTWNLRFNGEGRGLYDGPDNADQGHGMDRVYLSPSNNALGGTYRSGSGSVGTASVLDVPVHEVADVGANGTNSGGAAYTNSKPKSSADDY